MKEYEIVIVFSPRLSKEAVAELYSKVKSMILGSNGALNTEMDWGKRKLAYQIGDNLEGFYFILRANLDPSSIQEVENQLNINEDILRFLIINEVVGEISGPVKTKDQVS